MLCWCWDKNTKAVKLWGSSVRLKELRDHFHDICVAAVVMKRGTENCFAQQFWHLVTLMHSSVHQISMAVAHNPLLFWHNVYWTIAKNWWEAEREWAQRVTLGLQIRARHQSVYGDRGGEGWWEGLRLKAGCLQVGNITLHVHTKEAANVPLSAGVTVHIITPYVPSEDVNLYEQVTDVSVCLEEAQRCPKIALSRHYFKGALCSFGKEGSRLIWTRYNSVKLCCPLNLSVQFTQSWRRRSSDYNVFPKTTQCTN